MNLYTIGFTEKSAERFFELLQAHAVKKIIDTRINNVSQLAGFAKGRDLEYFSRVILSIPYEHVLDFAPTKELLKKYRQKEISWDEYEVWYLSLLESRKILASIDLYGLADSVLLCSEHLPDNCHRRLLAEHLQARFPEIEIIHLM
jgi:uncharacterized protein (DUF488 family)